VKAFDYAAPGTVREAVSLLAAQPAARPLAGGTDLLVQLRSGRRETPLVVDIKKIPECSALVYSPEAGLTIGAAAPCYRLTRDAAVRQHYPALAEVAGWIGGTPIQGRASLGGNLCNAAPSGDTIPLLMVLGATARIAGPSGEREVPVRDFCLAPGKTQLQPGELLVSLHIPAPVAGSGAAYRRFTPRNEMDIAVAGAGAYVELEAGRIRLARLALSSVAPAPLAVPAAEARLAGQTPSRALWDAVAAAAREAAQPISDMRGSAAYRKHLAGVMACRALNIALERAGGKHVD
jgi:carbon-monoxide dehydrogenase medium subunit